MNRLVIFDRNNEPGLEVVRTEQFRKVEDKYHLQYNVFKHKIGCSGVRSRSNWYG